MTQKRMWFHVVLISLVSLSAVYADMKADETAIHKRFDEWVAAWNKHDPKLLASFWVENGDAINPQGRVAKGRAAVEQLFVDEHTGAGRMATSTYNGSISDIRFAGNNVAVIDVDAEVTGMKTADGSAAPPFKHHVTWVAVKKGGKWMAFAARPCVPHRPPESTTAASAP
jgi:uncharacterized protein (TIGR02246 family)